MAVQEKIINIEKMVKITNQQVEQQIIAEFPDLSRAEISRFCEARKWDSELVREMLSASVSWRANVCSKEEQDRAWEKVAPLNVFHKGGKAHDGTPVIYIAGSRFDTTAASALEYTLAATKIMDEIFPSDQLGKFTLVVDGRKWSDAPNASTTELIPIVQDLLVAMQDNFPNRLQKCMLYPVPWWAMPVWSAAKMFMTPKTVKKITVFGGSDDENAKVDGISDYLPLSAFPEEYQSSVAFDYQNSEDQKDDFTAEKQQSRRKKSEWQSLEASNNNWETTTEDVYTKESDEESWTFSAITTILSE